jgi:formylglycine-generating enzyme required for sulfatase activity/2-polyprenyl-3-methyl-5-hydroxy-6-metoxy-1,4-benzoquinol methylase
MKKFLSGKIEHPYQKDDGNILTAGSSTQFRYRTMFDIVEMPWDWPVEVNYLEAAAFLRWKASLDKCEGAYRLPTEAEYHVLRGDGSGVHTPPKNWISPLTNIPIHIPQSVVGTRSIENYNQFKPLEKEPEEREIIQNQNNDENSAILEGGLTILPDGSKDSNVCGKFGKVNEYASSKDLMFAEGTPGNVNFRWHTSSPVHLLPPANTGAYDPHGNVWQWVEDHFSPLPGFEIHYLYDDFSAPCFDGWHNAIMGGSWASTGDLSSAFARYHFRRHFFQHMGFRYVRLPVGVSERYPGETTVSNLWESDAGVKRVSHAVTNGYIPPSERVPFPPKVLSIEQALVYHDALARFVRHCYKGDASTAKVLHIGSSAGAGTFALAHEGFGSALGIDSDEACIRTARLFRHHGQLDYERIDEGVISIAGLAHLDVSPSVRERVNFILADIAATPGSSEAASIPSDLFDVVVVDDILTRVTQPLNVMNRLGALVRTNGTLVIASANDWTPEHTPRNSWLGGFKMNGEVMPTSRILRMHTEKAGFMLSEVVDLPRMDRLTARTFRFDILEVSSFEKK